MGFFLLAAASRMALGTNQSPIQWVLEVIIPQVKRLGREADHSPSRSADEARNAWSSISNPTIRLHGVVLS
jgi:hypothetical protein